MAFWNKYPYTDFHELNLDWMLERFHDLEIKVTNWLGDVTPIIRQTVNTWLDNHPEATTTVEDGAITESKLNSDLLLELKNDYVTPQMFGAVGDGVNDDTQAFVNCFNSGKNIVIPSAFYNISRANSAFNGNVLYDFGVYNDVTPIYNSKMLFDNLEKVPKGTEYDLSAWGIEGYVEAVTYNTNTKRLVLAAYDTTSINTKLIIMNPNTFSIDEVHTINVAIVNAISYNENTNEYLVCCYRTNQGVHRIDADSYTNKGLLSTPDGRFYYAYDNYSKQYVSTWLENNVYSINVYDDTLNLVKSLSYNIETNSRQDTAFHKGIVYQFSWNKVICINVVTEAIRMLDVNSLSELEGITFIEDVPYIAYHTSYVDGIEYISKYSDDSAVNNLETAQNKTQFIENFNLNKILVDGVYRVRCDDANISTLNFPGNNGHGLLIVNSSIEEDLDINIINQTFIVRSGSYQHIYTRTSISTNAGSWSKWFTLMQSSRMLTPADTANMISANSDVISSSRLVLTYSGNLIFITGWILISNDTIAAATPLLTGLPKAMGNPMTTFLQDQNNNLSYVATMDYNTQILKAGRPMNNLSGHYINISIVYPLDETI